jgi:hypothetical protein
MKFRFSVAAILPILILLSGCTIAFDPMPSSRIDIFVLDLSMSNNKTDQLQKIRDDINSSVSDNSFGVPKAIGELSQSGPVTTIFTFIIGNESNAPTFKLQSASDVRKLWNDEFAQDTERNSASWSLISDDYSTYVRSILRQDVVFSTQACISDLDLKLKPKFVGDSKRGRIVDVLCGKAETLISQYKALMTYVGQESAQQTDIYGMLDELQQLVMSEKKADSKSIVSVTIASDMQHDTRDVRTTFEKLRRLAFAPAASCAAGKADRILSGSKLHKLAELKIRGIGDAQIIAEYSLALKKYWRCYFPGSDVL